MTMRPALDPKKPAEKKDYGIDWSSQLGEATISSSAWTVPAGIIKDAEDVDGLVAVIRLTGGTAGENYVLINSITTSEGEQLQEAISIRVRTPESVAGL